MSVIGWLVLLGVLLVTWVGCHIWVMVAREKWYKKKPHSFSFAQFVIFAILV